MFLHAVGVGVGRVGPDPASVVTAVNRWIRAQFFVMEIEVHRIETETIDTTVEPETNGV